MVVTASTRSEYRRECDAAVANKLIYRSQLLPELRSLGELIAYAYIRVRNSEAWPASYQRVLSFSVNMFLNSGGDPPDADDEDIALVGDKLWLYTRVLPDEKPDPESMYGLGFPDVVVASIACSPCFWVEQGRYGSDRATITWLTIDSGKISRADEPIVNGRLIEQYYPELGIGAPAGLTPRRREPHPRLFESDREQEAYETVCDWLPDCIVRARQSGSSLTPREDVIKIRRSNGVTFMKADFVIYTAKGEVCGIATLNPPQPGVAIVHVVLFD